MPVILSGAYRVFFPAAGLFAALAVPLWFAIYVGADMPYPAEAYAWHRHELIFGYLSAALAGFLLTAIPNWTGRAPVAGGRLLGLFLLWVLARIAYFLIPETGGWLSVAFLLVLAILSAHEILRGGNIRNLPICAMVLLFALADLLFLLVSEPLGQNMALGLALVMMALIGGRVTPAFTRNWLKMHGVANGPVAFGLIDRLALIATVAAVLSWLIAPTGRLVPLLALCAALLLLLRLSRWKGAAVAREPLLLALHLAYLWLPISFALLAFSAWSPAPFFMVGAHVHAIGAGAVGSMTLIVMARALLGHSGRPISGTRVDWLMLGLVQLGAIARVAAALGWEMGLHLAATFWPLGFLIFVLKYTPIAFAARRG